MGGIDLVVSDEWADVYVADVYDSSEQAYAYIADAIPSIEDLRAEFCTAFRRCAPGCEISAVPMTGRYLFVVVDGVEHQSTRRKAYAKAIVDMEAVYAGHVSKVERVRGACLLAARKMAAHVAAKATASGATSIMWTGGGPLHWPGSASTGRPRVAVEFDRDSIIVLLASYYTLVPAGAMPNEPLREAAP